MNIQPTQPELMATTLASRRESAIAAMAAAALILETTPRDGGDSPDVSAQTPIESQVDSPTTAPPDGRS